MKRLKIIIMVISISTAALMASCNTGSSIKGGSNGVAESKGLISVEKPDEGAPDKEKVIEMDREGTVENREYIKPISIANSSGLLELLAKENWSRESVEQSLGQPDSYFKDYDIYFNKGINIKYSYSNSDTVFNIIFDGKYEGSIVNHISVNSSKEQIIKSLGAPHFEDGQENVFGYKAENYYIFFVDYGTYKEVSVYRRDTGYDKSVLRRVIENKGEDFSLYDLTNEMMELWPDYDIYYNERGGLGVLYYSRGIEINNWNEDKGGPYITVYSNFEGDITENISIPDKMRQLEQFQSDMVALELKKDFIFEVETSRIKDAKQIDERRKQDGVLSPDKTRRIMDNQGGTYEHAGIFVCYVNKDKPDKEFKTGHFPGKLLWLDNRYFIYDVYFYGVFIYDTHRGESKEVAADYDLKHEYQLISAGEGKINYKDLREDKVYEKAYSFDADGSIILN